MKRYEQDYDSLYESETGRWVRYEDHKADRESHFAALRALEQAVVAYHEAQRQAFGPVKIVHAGRCGAELQALIDAADRLSSLTQQEKAATAKVEHVCGLQGYQRGSTPDPICPACAAASLTGKE